MDEDKKANLDYGICQECLASLCQNCGKCCKCGRCNCEKCHTKEEDNLPHIDTKLRPIHGEPEEIEPTNYS